jgi:hypothetical protein
MGGKTTLFVLLLLGPALLSAVRAGAAGRAALGVGMQAGVAVADDPPALLGFSPEFFTPKAQGYGALSAMLSVPLFSIASLGLGLELHGTTASSPAGGWEYQSHWGGGLRLSAACGWGLRPPSRLELGASIGGSFNFDLYTRTTLFFFYPGIFVEPYIALRSARRPNRSLALIMPVDYYFRRDLEFYGSIGIGVRWRFALQ